MNKIFGLIYLFIFISCSVQLKEVTKVEYSTYYFQNWKLEYDAINNKLSLSKSLTKKSYQTDVDGRHLNLPVNFFENDEGLYIVSGRFNASVYKFDKLNLKFDSTLKSKHDYTFFFDENLYSCNLKNKVFTINKKGETIEIIN